MLQDSSSNINAYDKETLNNLSSVFSDVLSALQQCLATASLSPTAVAKNVCARLKTGELAGLILGVRTCYKVQNNRENEHNSDKTKKNFSGSYTEVNPLAG